MRLEVPQSGRSTLRVGSDDQFGNCREMLVDTPQIVWHGGEAGKNAPILSIDTHPLVLDGGGDGGSRFVVATAGTDAEVRLWLVNQPTQEGTDHLEQPDVSGRMQSFVVSLGGHQRGVNVVRFSPDGLSLASASDGGAVVIWSVKSLAAWGTLKSDRDTTKNFLSGATEDIYDMAWSPDSTCIVCGSIDRRTHVWEVTTTRLIATVQHHTGYVQGTAWDPLSKYMATQSSDRSCRVYDVTQDGGSGSSGPGSLAVKIGHVIKSCVVAPDDCIRETPHVPGSTAAEETPSAANAETKRAAPTLTGTEGDIGSSIEPDRVAGVGTLAAAAAAAGGVQGYGAGGKGCGGNEGSCPTDANNSKDRTKPAQRKPSLFFVDETVTSFFRRLSWSPDGAFLITPTAQHWDAATQKTQFCTYLFTRGQFAKPAVCLPGLNKPSVAVRCNPRLFTLKGRGDNTETGSMEAPVCDLPYRAVFAVVSLDAIVVYDTEHSHPLTVATGLHYSGLTDACWSSDGLSLFVSSTDGYVSKIHFEEEELGDFIPESEVPWQTRRLHPVIYGWQQKAAHMSEAAGVIPRPSPPSAASVHQGSTSRKGSCGVSTAKPLGPIRHTMAAKPKKIVPTLVSGRHEQVEAGPVAPSTAIPLGPSPPSFEKKKRRITPTLLHNSGIDPNPAWGANGSKDNHVVPGTHGVSSSSTVEDHASPNPLSATKNATGSGRDRTPKKKRLAPTLVSTL